MGKFVRQISIFIAFICIVLAVLIFFIPHNDKHYLYAQKTKMSRLDTLPSPRLILTGGSNVAFGFDTSAIQDSLKVNVQNAGLQAPIGLRFMIDDLARHLKRGDTVIIMPEYQQFYGIYNGETNGLTPAVIYSGNGAWKMLNKEQIMTAIAGIPEFIKGNLKADKVKGEVYSAHSFNETGDETAHWSVGYDNSEVKATAVTGKFDSKSADELADKVRELREKGITVYFWWPVAIRSNYELNKENIAEIEQEMARRGVIFSVAPDMFVVEDSLAYDTHYHVNYEGVKINTDRFLKLAGEKGIAGQSR